MISSGDRILLLPILLNVLVLFPKKQNKHTQLYCKGPCIILFKAKRSQSTENIRVLPLKLSLVRGRGGGAVII